MGRDTVGDARSSHGAAEGRRSPRELPVLPQGRRGSPSRLRPFQPYQPRGCHPRRVLPATPLAGTSPGGGFRDGSGESGYLGGILSGMQSFEGFANDR